MTQMLDQKIFFNDLLDRANSKSKITKEIHISELNRLSKFLSHHKKTDLISISASYSLNDRMNPNLEGTIDSTLTLACQRCLGDLQWCHSINFIIDFTKHQVNEKQMLSDIDTISVDDEGISISDLLQDEILSTIPLSIMHKNVELCENIDKLSMFLRSSDKNKVDKNKPFSDLSELLSKDSN